MIRIAYLEELSAEPHLLDQLFRMRARVFGDRLKWDVTVRNGWECDLYDEFNPLCVLSLDDETRMLRGAVRLLPTTGRHMMDEVFNTYFDDPISVRSPNVWECTRFCVDPDHAPVLTPTGLNVATCELLYGICDLAIRSGIEQLLGVSEVSMLRIYRRSGWAPVVVGRSDRAGPAAIFAGLWDADPQRLQRIAERAGFRDNVTASSRIAA